MYEFILPILLGAAVLIGVVALWMGIYFWLNPYVREPDGKARVTGRCGDTMEICLRFNGQRVSETSHYTDGCAYSLNCVSAAADLARGRTPDEIIDIDANLIRDSVGGLPRDHMHCADLASETLSGALEDYMLKQRRKTR